MAAFYPMKTSTWELRQTGHICPPIPTESKYSDHILYALASLINVVL